MKACFRINIITAISAVTLASTPAAAQFLEHAQSKEMVVRDCILPSPGIPGDDEGWNYATPQGDLDRDGYADFFITGFLSPDPLSGRINQSRFSFYESPTTGIWDKRADLFAPFYKQSSYQEATAIMLAGPSGWRRMIGGTDCSGASGCLGVWDPKTLKLMHSINYPIPPSGYPAIGSFDQLRAAGDVNQDGFDDLYFNGRTVTGQWWVSGVFDGRTSSLLWQHYEPGYVGPQLWTEVNDSGPPPDFDQDGVPDQLCTYLDWFFMSHIIALSGVDGHEIWRYSNDFQGVAAHYRPGCANKDISGDGVPDVISVHGTAPGIGEITCIDGATGTAFWTVDWGKIENLAKAKFGDIFNLSFEFSAWVTPSSTRPLQQEFRLVVVTNEPTGLIDETRRVLCLDAATGEFLDFIDLPQTLLPWADESTRHLQHGIWAEKAYLLGDIDNDGFTEIGISVLVPSFFQWYRSYAFAILGQPTLTVPPVLELGSDAIGDLHIPTAAGFYYRVLISDAFEPLGGYSVGHWNTRLGSSNVLTASRQNPISGTLDSEGRAKFTVPIPSALVTSGKTLYFRALVKDQAQPGRIFTMSSLGEAQIH